MHVLLIKMSSMGDVIHTLPALTDAQKAIPALQIDWVVEPAFADIPAWHPAVHRIIPIALRRFRNNILKSICSGEIKTFYNAISEKKYDAIIDAQGLLKSVAVMKCATGKTHGYDKHSAREKIASYFYNKTYRVTQAHAVTRTRQLFASVLHYPLPTTTADYAIDPRQLPPLPFNTEKKYLVFLHGTTWATKHYPNGYWRQLLTKTASDNYCVYLPWGNETEKNRAEKFAAEFSHAKVLPQLSIAHIATLLKYATAVVSGDTGFAHLCAALSTPAISLYGPTDPTYVGTMGSNQIHLAATFDCAPCHSKTCAYAKTHHTEITPACYTSIPPASVWAYLQTIMQKE